jgi:hypothetical protein
MRKTLIAENHTSLASDVGLTTDSSRVLNDDADAPVAQWVKPETFLGR